MFKFFRNRIRKKLHGTLWLIIMPCIVVVYCIIVSIIVTVVLYEPNEKDNKDDTVYKAVNT